MTLPTARLFRSILAFAMAAAPLAAAPASAESGRRPVSVEFTYDPEASAATNYRILQWRVRRACTQQGPRTITVMPNEQACIAGMTNLTVAQLNRQDLNVAHAAATGATGRRELAAQ